MKTELQNNFEEIKKRMVSKYMGDKEDLFYYPPCIIPAWEGLIDEMIKLVEEYNMKNEYNIRFFQIKEKFGVLTAYLEWSDPEPRSGDKEIPEDLNRKIQAIAAKGHKICRTCGKQKVETVHESRIDWRCMDHYDQNTGWRIR